MFTRNRRRKTSKPSKSDEVRADEEERWMLVEDDSIVVCVDPAPYPKIGLNEEYKRENALGSRYSSPDVKEFQPFLSSEDRKLAQRPSIDLQRRLPRRLSSAFNGEADEAASSRSERTNGGVISPELFGENDDLKLGRTADAKAAPEDISEDRYFLECNQTDRCKAGARCGLDEGLFDDCSSQHKNASDVGRRRLNTWTPNASSAERALELRTAKPRDARQVTRTKSEAQFLDIFSKTKSKCSTYAAPRLSLSSCTPAEDQVNSELAPRRYDARTRRRSEPERRVAELTREERAGINGHDSSRLAKDSWQLVREMREDKEHSRDAQSERSFVLLVDQLADVRVRNRFVRQHAGKRRMAVCKELERVTIGNAIGEYLLDLREQLNITQVLNSMF